MISRFHASAPWRALAAAVLMTTSLMVPASAATITRTYDFSFSGFGGGAPYDPWAGSVSLTFDTSVDGFGAVSSFSSNLPAATYGAFSYVYGAASSILIVGDTCSPGACGVASGNNEADFVLIVTNPDAPVASSADYSGTAYPGTIFTSSAGVASVAGTGVPEPGTLSLLALGGLAVAGVRRMSCTRTN